MRTPWTRIVIGDSLVTIRHIQEGILPRETLLIRIMLRIQTIMNMFNEIHSFHVYQDLNKIIDIEANLSNHLSTRKFIEKVRKEGYFVIPWAPCSTSLSYYRHINNGIHQAL